MKKIKKKRNEQLIEINCIKIKYLFHCHLKSNAIIYTFNSIISASNVHLFFFGPERVN
jgi:hypothetical protein